MSFFKYKIRTKLSLVFIAVVLAVIGLTTLLWFMTVRSMLQKETTVKQRQIGERASELVSEFVRAKVRALIIHSQSSAFLTKDINLQKIDLAIFFSQDQDIRELTIIGKNGMEQVKTRRDGAQTEPLSDRSHSPSFLANTFRYSKEYIDDVVFAPDGEPSIIISVPIKTPTSLQKLPDLTTESSIIVPGTSDLLLGVLEAKVSLRSIFSEITDLGVEEESTAFIVDKKGRIIANKDKTIITPDSVASQYPPVVQHVETAERDPILHTEEFDIFEYKDQNNIAVLGSHSNVKDTSWAVVIQQPASFVYSNLNKVLNFSIILLLVSLGFTIPLSFLLAKRITRPVLAITKGANDISLGHLESRIHVDTDDELEDMADAFNTMTQKLQSSIDELKEDKDVIAGERNKLEVVLSGIEDAVIALDETRRVALVNTAAENLIGYTNTKVIGMKISEIFKLFDKEKEISQTQYCPTGEDTAILFDKNDVTLRSSNGIEKTIHIVVGQIDNSQSRVRYILTIQDITAKQKLEEMKVDFVSMAAHELRTPLTSVKGYLATFMNDYEKMLNEDQKMLIGNANEAAHRLTVLVESLLELTRMERTGITLQKKKISWISIVQKYVDDFDESAKKQKVSLTFEKPDTVFPDTEVDELRMGEVLSNLLSNAVKYTKAGGSVTVSVDFNPETNTLTTFIKDTGIGIPKDAVGHLFTKFYRVPGKLEQTARGTGLGLYISKKIIDLHNGKIWVQSEEGKGSTFAFSLPVG